MKLGLTSTQVFCLLIFTSILGVTCAPFNVTITCQLCNIGCSTSQYCYRISGSGYDRETCPSTPCTVGSNETVGIQTCTSDYRANTCGNGLCYTTYKRKGCANILSGYLNASSCPPFATVQTCGSCNINGTNCSNCYTIGPTGTSNLTRVCLSNACASYTNLLLGLTISYYGCSLKDTLGKTCQCCYELQEGFGSYPRLCVQNLGGSQLLSSESFKTYATNMIALNRYTPYGTASFERFMMLGALILAMFVILL